MSEVLYASPRTFRVWLYAVGHSTLLLRSIRDDEHATRIDLLFKPVKYMKLPRTLEGVQVRALTAENAPAIAPCGPGDRLFVLSKEHDAPCVVAGAMGWHEDDGGDNDPSFFSVPMMVW